MIKTRSQFYFISPISENNFAIPVQDNLGEFSASVRIGSYSPTDLGIAVSFALNDSGNQEYEVIFNRATRTYTISAPNNFDLLFATGITVGQSVHPSMGFDNIDLVGSNSYTSQNAAGFSYRPQLFLQDYVDKDDFQEGVDASINESASGVIEVITFGINNFYEFNIKYATDRDLGKDSIIEKNLLGVSELRDFLRFATTKANIEFMKDRDNVAQFDRILLESTSSSGKGVGFKLKELSRIDGFFETGKLKFRIS